MLAGQLGAALLLVGCGGEGGSEATPAPVAVVAPPPVMTPPPPAPAAPDFSAVSARLDRLPLPNVALIIGNENGVLYRRERGTMTTTRPVFIASASKLLLGLTAWLLVEDGTLSPATRASTLIDFWSRDPADPRSAVVLEQLFGFTSGFNGTSEDASCIGDGSFTLRRCVRAIHDAGVDTAPGQSFNYGNEHMQIAALMMSAARGQSIDAIMRQRLLDRVGASTETRYTLGAGDNPTYAGGMRSTGEDYGRVLTALLKGGLVSNRSGFLADRVGSRPLATVPQAISRNQLAWRYGWGFWKECVGPSYVQACEERPVISSAGAFGFTPWIDFARGYWAVIVLEEPLNQGFDPAQVSIALEQELQPLIAAALGR